MAHWKFGDGFAIRYGGTGDIKWFFDDAFRLRAGGFAVPPLHPAALVLDALEIVGVFLQWWEMHKQNQLIAAQFEERRVLWVTDMLAVWGAEISEKGSVRLDSARYLHRDLERLLMALIRTPKMDVPSATLLQIDRSAHVLVDINTLVHGELTNRIESMDRKEREGLQVPEYRPFYRIREMAEPETEVQFIDVDSDSPSFPFTDEDTLSDYLKNGSRIREFSPVEDLMIELRENILLLKAARAFPPSVRTYSREQVFAGEDGDIVPILATATTQRQPLD